MATSVAYTLDDETEKSTTRSISANGKYTVEGINAESVTFYCMGNSISTRLYVNYLGVIYAEASLSQKVAEPSFSVADGTRFNSSLTITARCETAGARIYYTMSDTGIPEDPTELSDEFPAEGLTIDRTATIKVVAVQDGLYSTTVSATYTKVEPGLADVLRALVFEKEGVYHAAVNNITSNALQAKTVNCMNGKVICPTPEADGLGWYVDEVNGNIKSVDGNYVAYTGTSTNLKFQTSVYPWDYDEANNYWYITASNGTKRTLLYSESGNYIKAYAVTQMSNYSGTMQIMPFADGYVRNVTGAASAQKFGTICLPCDVVAGDFSGAEFYSVLGKVEEGGEVTSIALSEPLTELKAGVPYIFKAVAENIMMVYTGEPVAEPGTENGLVGSLTEKIDVEEGKYVISGNRVQLCGTGCYIDPNRAYLDLDLMSVYVPVAGVNARLIPFEEATYVSEVKPETEKTVDVYTLSGVCLRRKVDMTVATEGLSKGVYIIDGRKVVVTE